MFYCESCEVPICRQCVVITHRHPEHKQTELKDAAKKKKTQLQQLQERCKKKENEVKEDLQEIRKFKRDFDFSVSEARTQIDKTVLKLKSSIDQAKKEADRELSIIEKEGLDNIKNADEQLTSLISRMSTAEMVSKSLKEKGSEFELAADYKSLKSVLETSIASEPAKISAAGRILTGVEFEEATDLHGSQVSIGRIKPRRKRDANKAATMKMEFGNTGNEKLNYGWDVAVTPTQEIVVTDTNAAKVRIYNPNGEFKSTFSVNVGIDAGKSSSPWCIQVGPDGLLYVTDYNSPFVKIFDLQGMYRRYFHTVSPDDVAYNTLGSSSLQGLAINSKHQVLVGNCTHNFISYHSLDGTHVKSIKMTIRPAFLAVTSKGNIVVSSYSSSTGAQIIDGSGNVLSNLHNPAGVSSWGPAGVVVSKYFRVDDDEDEVFIVDYANGHAVYRYSSSGKYIGCVTKDVSNACGLTLSADEKRMFVADTKTVKCFEI